MGIMVQQKDSKALPPDKLTGLKIHGLNKLLQLGLCPGPCWGAYSASRTPSWIWGQLAVRKGGRLEMKGWEKGKGKEGKEGKREGRRTGKGTGEERRETIVGKKR